MLNLENVNKIYTKNNQASIGLENVNLSFNIGDFVLIEGSSGSGKSTLLNIISGKLFPTSGNMLFNEIDTNTFSKDEWDLYKRNIISYISQDFDLIYDMTVKNNILVGLFNDIEEKDLLYILKLLKIDSLINKKVMNISKGECARVSIARALLKDNPIILIDEGTSNLDSENSKIIFDALKTISDKKLIIVVSHKNEFDNKYFNRHIIIENHRIKEICINNKTFHSDEFVSLNGGKQSDFLLIKYIFPLYKKNRVLNIMLYSFVLLVISILCFTIGSLNTKTVYNETIYFYNMDENRVILIKNDKSSFNENDYNELKNSYSVDKIVKNDFLLDLKAEINMDIKTIGVKSSMFKMDLIDDETILDDDEVIIGTKSGFIDLRNNRISLINELSDNSFVFNVSGFVEKEDNTIYMNEETMNKVYQEYIISNANKKINGEDIIINIYFDDNIPNKMAITNTTVDERINLSVYNDNYNKTINDLQLYESEEILNKYGFLDNEKYIIMNYDDYFYLSDLNRYQISVFINNINESKLNSLSKDYFVYYPNYLNVNSSNPSIMYELTLTSIILISIALLLFIIIRVNNKQIEKTINDEFKYYRFGYSKKSIVLCNIANTIFNFIIAIIAVMFINILIKNSYLSLFILEYYSNLSYLFISLIIVLIFSIFQYKKFMKEFKKGEEI